MARTKLTVRRAYEKMHYLPPWLMNIEYGRKSVRPFKIKLTLPAQKIVTIKKNGQPVKTINVPRKSKYFSGRNRLSFKT